MYHLAEQAAYHNVYVSSRRTGSRSEVMPYTIKAYHHNTLHSHCRCHHRQQIGSDATSKHITTIHYTLTADVTTGSKQDVIHTPSNPFTTIHYTLTADVTTGSRSEVMPHQSISPQYITLSLQMSPQAADRK